MPSKQIRPTVPRRIFEPLERDISVLVLGTTSFAPRRQAEAFELLDAWVACGGNAVDSAHDYGFLFGEEGDAERTLGAWLERASGIDGDLIIISKGCHPNADRERLTAEDLVCDIRDSLARLKQPAFDLYLLHRDDPREPVGPILEALNEQKSAGRLRAFGASNWSVKRIEAANEYAATHGLEGFCCSSTQLSLARQVVPQYPGGISAGDPDILRWHLETGFPLFAWSALAGGFFTERFQAVGRADPGSDVARIYDSTDNNERLRRASELASDRGVSANEIALAWVLAQPFPVFAIIGPECEAELRDSLRAVDVDLSESERQWLDLRGEA